jgi:hypothetical protein
VGSNPTPYIREKMNKRWLRIFHNLCKKYEVSPDLIDWQSLDWSLSYSELKRIVLGIVKQLSNSEKADEEMFNKDEMEFLEQQANLQEQQQTMEKFEEAIKKIKEIQNPEIDNYFRNIKELIKITVKGKNNFLVLKGAGGLGKTYCVLKTLAELGLTKPQVDYIYCSSHITPLSLYHLLYKNKDKVIFLDDVENLLNIRENIGILKGATWESAKDLRIVNYYSTSERLEAPLSFVFEGKILMCLNRIPTKYKEEVESLLSRAWVYEVNFDYSTMIKIFYELAKVLKIDFEVVDFIKENSCEATTLDFRTLIKSSIVYEYYKQNPSKLNGEAWKDIVKDLLAKNTNPLLACVLRLIKSNLPTKEQIAKFIEETGYSRRQFFYLKRKLIEKIGAKVQNAEM